MRILIVSRNGGIVGGLETYLSAVIPGLQRSQHTIAFAYEHPPADGTEIHSGPVATFQVTRQSISSWQPDVVYLHDPPKEPAIEWLLESYPVVLYAHDYQGTCATGRKAHALPSLRPCSRRLGPACLAFHYIRRCGGLNPLTAIRDYNVQTDRQNRLSRYRLILVASEHMRQEYLRHGVLEHRACVLHLPPTEIQPLAQVRYRERTGNILFPSRLTDLKGGSFLVRAVAQAQEQLGFPLQLIIAGRGQQEETLRREASNLDVRATFLGWISRQNLVDQLDSADIVAVPSVWPEPFGLVGIEAACRGVPAVAFDVGGIREWLVGGESGELAPGTPPTAEGLAAAIVRALADSHYLHKLRVGAWQQSQRFTMTAHIDTLVPLLESASQ